MCRRLWAPGQTPEEHHRQAQRGQTRYCLWKRTVYGLEDRTPACSEPFAVHLFNAEWQYKQYNYIRKNPGEGTLVLGMDFAENFLTKNQDEISQVHFGHYRQITVHPIVSHYICPNDNCQEVVKEATIIVSDNLAKDAVTVHAFTYAVRKTIYLKTGRFTWHKKYSSPTTVAHSTRAINHFMSCRKAL